MPANPYEAPLSFVYRPPLAAPVLFVCAILAAGLAAHSAQMPVAFKIPCHLLLLLCLAGHLRRHLRLRRRPRPILHLNAAEKWHLYHGTRKIPLRLLPESLVHPYIVILSFRAPDRRRHDFILTPRNTDPEQLRLLRVRLRHPRRPTRPGFPDAV